MAKFFKTFAKGILYVLALPLLVIFLAIYFLVSLISFLVLSIQGIVLFFKGESLVGELEEDKIAKQRLDALNNPLSNNVPINVVNTPSIEKQSQIISEPINEKQEEEISLILNDVNNQDLQNEEEIFSPLTEPEPEEEISDEGFENLNISHDHSYDREEYIIEEPTNTKEEKDSVNFYDYNGGDE